MTTQVKNVTEEMIRLKMEDSFLRRASIKKKQLADDANLERMLDENIFVIGHILLDLHEEYSLEMDYEMFTEFEIFKTPLDIVNYLKNRKDIA